MLIDDIPAGPGLAQRAAPGLRDQYILGTLWNVREVAMPPLTHRTGSCDYGPCPNIFDYKPKSEMVAIQGTRLTDPEALAQLKDMPSYETVVLIPRTPLLEYASMILQEAQPA